MGNSTRDIYIGDIVWGRIGKFPFWPAIVCIDPKSNEYLRDGKNNKLSLHVRFFNDRGRSSWIQKFETFAGKNHLLKQHPRCLYSTTKKVFIQWFGAVEEANGFFLLDRSQRLVLFSRQYKVSLSFSKSATVERFFKKFKRGSIVLTRCDTQNELTKLKKKYPNMVINL